MIRSAPVLRALLAGVTLCLSLWQTDPVQADTYYSLEMDSARLQSSAMVEDGRRYRIVSEGGAARAQIGYDASAGSDVLKLGSWASPQGARRDRSEVQIYSGVEFGRMWFVGMRVLQPQRNVIGADKWHLFMQCGQAGTQVPPPISLNLEPNMGFSLVTRSDEDRYNRLWQGKMRVGRWHDIVLGFRPGARGRAQMWVDGRKVVDRQVPMRWKAGQPRCNLKFGMYRAPSQAPFQMWFDDVRLGDSYADVAR